MGMTYVCWESSESKKDQVRISCPSVCVCVCVCVCEYVCVYVFPAQGSVCVFVFVQSLQSCPALQPHGLQPTRLLCPRNFPEKNTTVGCHFLLQGIFLTQGLKPYLLHCRQILYHLSHQGMYRSTQSKIHTFFYIQ